MERATAKAVRRFVIGALVLTAGLVFVPFLIIFYLIAGLLDVMRNKSPRLASVSAQFSWERLPTWLLSSFDLLVDLFCYPNKGVYQLQDLPPAWRTRSVNDYDAPMNRAYRRASCVQRRFRICSRFSSPASR